jgi:hypothetical protein
MSLGSSVRSHLGSHHLLPLIAVIAATLLATKVWKSALWTRLFSSSGPWVEFEVRLPPGILLPDDSNIEITLWANGMGRGCGRPVVHRSAVPPILTGMCSVVVTSTEYVMSLRLSRFYEGYWKMPFTGSMDVEGAFGLWQRIEFTRAPAGEREVSALPHGDYYVRYLVRF